MSARIGRAVKNRYHVTGHASNNNKYSKSMLIYCQFMLIYFTLYINLKEIDLIIFIKYHIKDTIRRTRETDVIKCPYYE